MCIKMERNIARLKMHYAVMSEITLTVMGSIRTAFIPMSVMCPLRSADDIILSSADPCSLKVSKASGTCLENHKEDRDKRVYIKV